MNQPLSPFRRGADNGFLLGIYISVLYICMLLSSKVPVLNIVTLTMMLAVPVIVYFLLRRDRVAPGGMPTLGALWVDGLITFLCGGLIGSLVMFVYLRWIEPDFIISNLEQTVEMLKDAPDASGRELADEMQTAIDSGFSVSPIMFAMSMLWLAATSGSILSLIVSAIVVKRHPLQKPKNFF